MPHDPQTSESAGSLEQTRKRVRVLAGDILGLAGPGQKIAGIMPCTIIRPGDMAEQILSREKHPEWNGERTKLLYQVSLDYQKAISSQRYISRKNVLLEKKLSASKQKLQSWILQTKHGSSLHILRFSAVIF